MFQFGRFPPQALWIQTWVTGHDPGRVSPFGYLRIKALLAAPRSFSQPHASFIGSWRQGIHREPLLTWLVDARARYRVLKVQPWTRHLEMEVAKVRGLKARTLRTEQCATPVVHGRPRSTPLARLYLRRLPARRRTSQWIDS